MSTQATLWVLAERGLLRPLDRHLGLLLARPRPSARLVLWAGIGFCGSLTTFSSWMLELVRALDQGELQGGGALPVAGGPADEADHSNGSFLKAAREARVTLSGPSPPW